MLDQSDSSKVRGIDSNQWRINGATGDIQVSAGQFTSLHATHRISRAPNSLAQQVKAKCRDVAPRAYSDPVKEAS